jgi:hypothetical protein
VDGLKGRGVQTSLMKCCSTGFVPMESQRKKVMHDNNGRRQLTSKTFRQYLIKNDIKDRPIPTGCISTAAGKDRSL